MTCILCSSNSRYTSFTFEGLHGGDRRHTPAPPFGSKNLTERAACFGRKNPAWTRGGKERPPASTQASKTPRPLIYLQQCSTFSLGHSGWNAAKNAARRHAPPNLTHGVHTQLLNTHRGRAPHPKLLRGLVVCFRAPPPKPGGAKLPSAFSLLPQPLPPLQRRSAPQHSSIFLSFLE